MIEADKALQAHLLTMADLPDVVFENAIGAWNGSEYVDPIAPYILVSFITTPPQRYGRASSVNIHSGRMILSLLVDDGLFAASTKKIAQSIIDHFPMDLSLTSGGVGVNLTETAYADDGFNDGTYWRTNINVRWQAIITN